MGKKFRKRIHALILAVVLAVTTFASVCTVAAGSSVSGSTVIDFSFPFDFLLFCFGDAEKEMTEEELELQRDVLREQSQKVEKEAGLTFVYEYAMETPVAIGTLDMSGCKGPGTFVFANPDLVPEKGVTVCEFIFTPSDVNAFEYEKMLGWDKQTNTLRRYAEVICSSLAALEEEVTDAPVKEEESVIPNAVVKDPEVTPEVTPEATPETTPEATPEVTPETTPEATPEVTPETTPEVTPETTPEVTPEVPLEGTLNFHKTAHNLVPEITTVPEAVTPTPEVIMTPTPEPVVTVPVNPGSSIENGVQLLEKDEAVVAFEEQVMSFPEGDMTVEKIQVLVDLTHVYEEMTAKQQDALSSDALNKLLGLQEEAALVNHTSNGVTVTGNLPWYVELVVVLGNDTDTYVPTGLETIVPYEMCLWNLLTDSEYVLGGGEKVTLSMAVPENVHLYDGLTIVHYMDETHYEYIELTITGDIMSFETASFSPFNVAGSTVIVGGKPSGNTSKPSGSVTTKPSDSSKPSDKDESTTKPSTNKPSNNKPSTNKPSNNKPSSSKPSGTTGPVKTGDTANISQFIFIGAGAVVLVVICILLLKRSKKEEE